MKRIFSILCAVCLLLTLAVPIMAAGTYTVSGKWVFNDTLDLSSGVPAVDVSFIFGKNYGFGMSGTKTGFFYDWSSTADGVVSSFSPYTLDGGWASSSYKTVNFGDEPQEVSEYFYNWLIKNATPPSCDGSTCPIADINGDSVCDECGHAVAMSLRPTETSELVINGIAYPLTYKSAETEGSLADLYSSVTEGYPLSHFTLFRDGSVLYLRVFYYSIYQENGQIVNVAGGNMSMDQYRFATDYWAYNGRFTFEPTDTYPADNLMYTSRTVYNTDGTVYMAGQTFTPPPPTMAETIQGVTGEGMQVETLPKVVGTMKTLALCGVGCLALLVVLKLFGKRSLISLR